MGRVLARDHERELADRRRGTLFDIQPAENALLTATNNTELAESAVFALGAIGTASAQSKLFEISTAPSRPVPVRERALSQLTAHFQRHGVMLTELQADELRKAARQEADPQLQSAFAATLGALHPDLRQASKLLKAVPSK